MGYDAGNPWTAQPWLTALAMAVNRQFPEGARGQGVALMSDHGSQPTAMVFRQAWASVGMHQACTSDHTPQGNADPERLRRTRKEEGLWRQEGTCPVALRRAMGSGVEDDQAHDLHAALGDKTPGQDEREDHRRHRSPCVAA